MAERKSAPLKTRSGQAENPEKKGIQGAGVALGYPAEAGESL
jgi:hypothetical protein